MDYDDFVSMQAAQQLFGWPSQPVKKEASKSFENDAIAELASVFGSLGK